MPATESSFVLSDRVASLKPSATLAVTARIAALRAHDADVIGFGAGEPDFGTPDHIKQTAVDALAAGQTHYTPVAGPPSARAAIARKLERENGIACAPEHIVITVGAKHALYLVLQCLLDPGRHQQVIVLTPAWVSYRPMIELAGGEVVEVDAGVDDRFKITADRLEEAITPDTRAVILNSPSNPCGTMYQPDEIRELAAVLERHPHVAVISDEIYEKLIYGDGAHLSPGSIESLASRAVTINGLSKAYAMTGWRIGYLCAPGGDGRLAAAAAGLQSQMTSNITSFCYAGIIEALEHGAESVESMRRIFSRRAELMHACVGRWPDVICPKPEGAFYVFPDIGAYLGRTSPGGRPMETSLAFAEALLEEVGVGVVPGEAFGGSGGRNVRLSFACSEEQIEAGCGRVEGWLGKST